jgi:hypothetical protein
MAITRKRLTAAERVAALKAKIKEIEAAERKAKKVKKELTRDSEGVSDLFALMDKVALQHKLTTPQLVREIVRIRRTRLKFK